jgi:hypothetical protein
MESVMSEAQAVRMAASAEAILGALSQAGLDNDPQAIAASLGSVVGCVAVASNDPAATLAAMVRVAEGIISGELLDPA